MGDKKVEEKKTGVARRLELIAQISAMQGQLKADIQSVVKENQGKRRKALNDSLAACSRNSKETAEVVASLKQRRDQRKKEAEREYEAALRRAQSERDKVLKSEDEVFEQARDGAEAALVERNNPIREQHQKTDEALEAEGKEKLELLHTAYETSMKPLTEELQALELAEAEKKAKREAKEKEAQPVSASG